MRRISIAVAFAATCLLVVASLSGAAEWPSGARASTGASPQDAGIRKSRDRADAGAALAEDRPCRSDADCALTRIPTGQCCPSLCEGRPVTKQCAAKLDQSAERCAREPGGCPQPLCRPPPFVTVPACENGRCVAKAVAKSAE